MELGHIIDDTATIKGADIEKVYDDCVIWLSRYGANILKENRPNLMKAYHKGARAFHEDWSKNITISLQQSKEDVCIRIVIDHGSSLTLRENVYEDLRRSWIKIVEDLWGNIGVKMDDQIIEHLFPKSTLEKIINDHRQRVLFFVFVLMFGFFIILVYPPVAIQASIPIVFIIIIIIGEAQKISFYKKRLRELYPDR